MRGGNPSSDDPPTELLLGGSLGLLVLLAGAIVGGARGDGLACIGLALTLLPGLLFALLLTGRIGRGE